MVGPVKECIWYFYLLLHTTSYLFTKKTVIYYIGNSVRRPEILNKMRQGFYKSLS